MNRFLKLIYKIYIKMKKLILFISIIIVMMVIGCSNGTNVRINKVDPTIGYSYPVTGYILSSSDSSKLWKVSEIKYDSCSYLMFSSTNSSHIVIVKK